MGMAASQARYLALVARKSNCEFEGQQINQSRLILANQTANLFNQMLGLTVPVPPSTQDFTKIQYSYTDGVNASTIDSWKQLSNDPEYNYIVQSHYYTDVYTGSLKKMSDPQVQVSSTSGQYQHLGNWEQIESAYNAMSAAKAVRDSSYDTWQYTKQTQERNIANILSNAQGTNGYRVFQSGLNIKNNKTVTQGYTKYEFGNNIASDWYDVYVYNNPDTLANFNVTSNYNNMNAGVLAAKDNNAIAQSATDAAAAQKAAKDAADSAVNAATEAKNIATAIYGANSPEEADADAILQDAIIAKNNAYTNGQSTVFYQQAADKAQQDAIKAQSTAIPWVNATTSGANSVLQTVRDQVKLGILSLDSVNNDILSYNTAHGILNTEYISDIEDLINFAGAPPYSNIQKEVLSTYGIVAEYEGANNYSTGNVMLAKTLDIESLDTDLPTSAGPTTYSFGGYPIIYGSSSSTTNAEYLAQIETAQSLIDADYNTYEAAEEIYQNALNFYNSLNRPTYIGNSELTLLGTLTEDQSTELLQVVKDLKAQNVNSHLLDCFADDGTYLGGVYSFRLNGNTYYTTFDDLDDAYASNVNSNNYIDAQYKMPYYNASYISTRIDFEGKALLETDGEGRFTSVRFENDSVTYTLKTETITDDVAYQDAMNQFYYENAKYDKMISDINAQTSIIQQEDQQLELRLKQLDTEQNALKTEMDAVQKVVQDNVDASFKTFGG